MRVRYGKWNKKATVDMISTTPSMSCLIQTLGYSSAKQEPREATHAVRSILMPLSMVLIESRPTSKHYHSESVHFWNIPLSSAAAILHPMLSRYLPLYTTHGWASSKPRAYGSFM